MKHMARIADGEVVNLELWPDDTPEVEDELIAYDPDMGEQPYIGLSYDKGKQKKADRWEQPPKMEVRTDEDLLEQVRFETELEKRIAARMAAQDRKNAKIKKDKGKK